MTTRDEVLAAINRIERAGHAGEATKAAQLDLLMLPPQDYDRILNRLRTAFPEFFPPNPPSGPPAEQQGEAAKAMKKAQAVLSQQQSATAEFDRQVIEALLHAHKTTEEGRQQLDDLEAQIDRATRTWDLSTAAGAREFQRFLIGKLRQIVAVVQDTNDDDASKQALAAAWAALYASQADGPPAAGPDIAPSAGATAEPKPFGGTDADPPLDAWPEDDPGVRSTPQHGAPTAPPMPAVPGFGGGAPSGAGPLPTGGVPGGMTVPGMPPGAPRRPASEPLDDDLIAADEPSSEHGDKETADDTAAAPGPTTVTLPNEETVTAATPQLAAVVQAAAGGMPIADAFRQQGITIPPPGTAVTGPVEQSRVTPGDIGMFTDRHALALGNSKALLDGQIQHIANVRGPSFLGWQHPPTLEETTTASPTPTPTQPSATARA